MEGRMIRDFRELIVWQKSHQLFLDIMRDIEGFPKTQATKIVIDQLLRSCGSISANIAEGFGRKKGKEYVHYLIIARGSTTETLNWLLKCVDANWFDKETFHHREKTIEEVLKMLNRMIGQKITS
ncbi:MAG TPA: four helix bundle protein [Nitrospirae bacterium]|nr:four helix bundle protein [Nitrospirota bacterium]